MKIGFEFYRIISQKNITKNKRENSISSPINKLNNNFQHINYYFNNPISFRGLNNDFETGNKTSLETEKEKIADTFIRPILENRDDIPSAFLLYSEENTKTSAFINHVAKNANVKVVELDTSSEDFSNDTHQLLEESREHYFKTNQRTMIIVKNSDLLFSESKLNYKNVVLLKNWLDNCAKKPSANTPNSYAATFFLETNNPQKINSEVLNLEKIKNTICLTTSGLNDIKSFISSYIEKIGQQRGIQQLSDKELSEIAQKLNPNRNLGAYSDSRIKVIMDKACMDWENKDNNFSQVLEKRIQATKRDITPRVVANSFETRKWLIANEWIEKPELKNIRKEVLDAIEEGCTSSPPLNVQKQGLTRALEENATFIQYATNKDFIAMKNITVKNQSLVDFWLDIAEEDKTVKQNSRLKDMWFNEILQDSGKTNELIAATLDVLQKENETIKTARNSYKDIIDNDDTITPGQKEILIQQQENKLFFDVVVYNAKPDGMLQIEINTLSTLKTLENEKNNVLQNAQVNVFEPARDISILYSEDSDDIAIANYIFQLLSQVAKNGNAEEKQNLQLILQEFNQAKEIGDDELLNLNWKKLVQIAESNFETRELENLTDRNIAFLNSINEHKKGIQDKTILNLLNNQILTIEQKEFIARYAKDSNFKMMIKNPNIDINKIIEDLVFFEAGNKKLIQEANLVLSDDEFNKIITDKFKQINHDAKDINIQGDKIVSKLDDINSSINSQSDIVLDFADNFAKYAQNSLSLQSSQLEQLMQANQLLSSIDVNTKEISAYTRTLARAKLLELEKDKYYKEIVPELTKLLPKNEQIDIQDFLSKVDELAKKEKNSVRKKKILKAAVIIAGIVAAGLAIYYFGPAVVAHLTSQIANPAIATSAIVNSSAATGVARKMGNSGLINFLGRSCQQISYEIKNVKSDIKIYQEKVMKYPSDPYYARKLDSLKETLKKLLAELSKAVGK